MKSHVSNTGRWRQSGNTRATELLSDGENPAEAAQHMGHSVQMFLEIYLEFIEEFSDVDNSIMESKIQIKWKPFWLIFGLFLPPTPLEAAWFWRRRRDSNSRRAFTLAGFQDQCIKPLCHPSTDRISYTTRLFRQMLVVLQLWIVLSSRQQRKPLLCGFLRVSLYSGSAFLYTQEGLRGWIFIRLTQTWR